MPITMSVTCRRRPPLADRVEQRDQRLGALEPEALLPDVLGVQERLERLGGVQPLEDPQLVLGETSS
jgi:hypothetical protein